MSSSDLPPFEYSKPFQLTQSPNPTWLYAQSVDSTPEGKEWMDGIKSGWKTIDISKEDPRYVLPRYNWHIEVISWRRKLYALMTSGIAPRPIAFVSSVSADGVENLAPYSWFNQVSANPPVISISCTNVPDFPDGVKDTVRNIKATKGFTVNIISEAWVEQANVACTTSPPDVSEWEFSGLTKEPSTLVKAPRVKESAFSMECELLQAIPVPPNVPRPSTTLILGAVKYVHVRNDVLHSEKGVVDPARMKPVSRMGGVTYARSLQGFDLSRSRWEDIKDDVENALEEKKNRGI
ncbi:hypothetical protein BDQ17DRAFT_1425270 [Cyathus striatus]|nr:hypothetical protein BDQ17DRAFT_1425270 [Cyathus striatus]